MRKKRTRAEILAKRTRPDSKVNVTKPSRSKYTPAGKDRNVPVGNR